MEDGLTSKPLLFQTYSLYTGFVKMAFAERKKKKREKLATRILQSRFCPENESLSSFNGGVLEGGV